MIRSVFRQALHWNPLPKVTLPNPITHLASKVLFSDQPFSHSFDRVTRYLKDRAILLKKGDSRTKEITHLCSRLTCGDWAAIIETYKGSLDYLATDSLKAFHDQQISMEQFTTLTFLWSLSADFPGVTIEYISLFHSNGKVNGLARNYIEQTFKKPNVSPALPGYLNREQIDNFFTRMQNEPKSEQVFFSVPIYSFLNKLKFNNQLEHEQTIADAIRYRANLNIFNYFRSENGICRMLASLSMQQQFLIVYAGLDKAIKITPVIDMSSVEDIARNGKTNTRDLALPFPGVDLPDELDLYKAPKHIDSIHHDGYHHLLCSDIPLQYRPAFMHYSDAILKLKTSVTHPLILEFLTTYYELIIDMEYHAFRKDNSHALPISHPTPAQIFIWSLVDKQEIAIGVMGRRKKIIDTIDHFIEIAELNYYLLKNNIYQKLAAILHSENFCSRYNITKEDLERVGKHYEKTQAQTRASILKINPFSMPHFLQTVELSDGKKMTYLELIQSNAYHSKKLDLCAQLLVVF